MHPLNTVLLVSISIICVTSESFKDVVFQLKDQSELPYVFEGIAVELRCIVDISKYSSVSWGKDDVEILSFKDEKLASENLPDLVTVNPVYTFGNRGFYSIVFTNLTIADHRGLYSCIAGQSIERKDSDFFLLDVRERKPVCASQKGEVEEFLVGESLSLCCHNPLYHSPKIVRWYKEGEEGALQAMRTEYDYTSVDNATFTLEPSMNGSRFACFALDDEETALTLSDYYTCSFGPVYIFDSSYVTIDETSSGDNRTFSCRLIPKTVGASLQWTELPAAEAFHISTSEFRSDITFFDLSNIFDIGTSLNIACEVTTPKGENFAISKSFSVTSPNLSGGAPSKNDEDFPILLVVAAAGVAVVFIVGIAIIVLCYCAIAGSRDRSKTPSQTLTGSSKSNDYAISYRKDSRKTKELVRLPDGRLKLQQRISIPEDDIDFEVTEKSPLSSPGDGIYDLPPPSNHEDVEPSSPIYANKETV